MHAIKVNFLLSTPLGNDFDKDKEAPFGTIPWMRDRSNGLELNDLMAIVQYLGFAHPGPLTPENNEAAGRANIKLGLGPGLLLVCIVTHFTTLS